MFWSGGNPGGGVDLKIMAATAEAPIIRDEPLSDLARAIVESLQFGPRDKQELQNEFGDAYWHEGVVPLFRYAFARFPVIERTTMYHRVGPFSLIPEPLRCRIVLSKPFDAEYFGGTIGPVAGGRTVWNGWRLPEREQPLYPHAKRDDCEVQFWNEYGSDSFFLSEGRDFELVPWKAPLADGIDSVDPPAAIRDGSLLDSIKGIDRELIAYLARHPNAMYELSPRKFEMLVAELFSDMGYDVRLTPQTRDGGRDILLVCRIPPSKELLFLVECKRLGRGKTAGVDVIQRFLWILDRQDRANGGMIATTARFSKEARRIANDYSWRLSLHDFKDLSEWLSSYGQWDSEKLTGLWLPKK